MKFSLKSCILVLFVDVFRLQLAYCEGQQNSTFSEQDFGAQTNFRCEQSNSSTQCDESMNGKNMDPAGCFKTRNRTLKRSKTHSETVVAGDKFCICCDISISKNPNSSCEAAFTWQKDNVTSSKSDEWYVKNSRNCIVVLETKYNDAGYYRCSTGCEPTKEYHGLNIRVHGKLRPLWPFLVLCVQAALLGLTLWTCRRREEYAVLEESDNE